MCYSVDSSDYHFGLIKNSYSDLCVVAVKEVFGYIRKLNIPLVICFGDIKSGIDCVNYHRMFRKLLKKNVISLIV